MAKKRSGRAGYSALLWVPPLLLVVLAPLFLHEVSQDLSGSADDHILVASALVAAVVSLSLLGCICQDRCGCPPGLPFVILAFQVAMVATVLLAKFSLLQGPGPPPRMPVPPQSAVLAGAQAAVGARASADAAGAATGGAGAGAGAGAAAPVGPGPGAAAQSEVVPAGAVARPSLPGWRDAGSGYCEDGESHQEFNSLHALHVSLEACAAVAASDARSLAFDFSPADGGCDVRYASGALPDGKAGYEWWGWGAGITAPTGSGQQKHGTEAWCYAKLVPPTQSPALQKRGRSTELHPDYGIIIREYPFQPVRNDRGKLVNIILVRAPFRTSHQESLYEKYKDEILFLGISSFEDYPLSPPNPFSAPFPKDKYVGLFPGFLHMFRDTSVFPSHVKLLLMSQSDFCLPPRGRSLEKKYDFTFSGSDQDVHNDCVGWANFAKNWSFVKQALEVMCGELKMTGVLVATKDKQNRKACTIPASCQGLMTQTQYINQDEFFSYVKQSRFLLVPQVHDASPRVASQALALDVPLLMNWNIMGGWKYVNEKTGEFFHDIGDFRESVQRLLSKVEAGAYEPRSYVDQNLGDEISGARLMKFVQEHFADRVALPAGTRLLFPSGA